MLKWRPWQDSNLRPLMHESMLSPTELQGHIERAPRKGVLPFPLRQRSCHSGAREGLDAAYKPDGSGATSAFCCRDMRKDSSRDLPSWDSCKQPWLHGFFSVPPCIPDTQASGSDPSRQDTCPDSLCRGYTDGCEMFLSYDTSERGARRNRTGPLREESKNLSPTQSRRISAGHGSKPAGGLCLLSAVE